MSTLSQEGRRIVDEIAGRTGFSPSAVESMLYSVANGYGTQAQFNHPEFGGMGQWSQGGMIMIGDMFNNGLKDRVSRLCSDLASALQSGSLFQAQQQMTSSQSQSQYQGSGGGFQSFNNSSWWPAELGSPSSTGAQNDMRYAVFPNTRRLAIFQHGELRVYDTGSHQIGGVSQQQSGGQSLTFTSQYGTVRADDLELVSPKPEMQRTPEATQAHELRQPHPAQSVEEAETGMRHGDPASVQAGAAIKPPPADDIFALIERLHTLHEKGILSAQEYAKKKEELLSRL